jgi:hypothetical protein
MWKQRPAVFPSPQLFRTVLELAGDTPAALPRLPPPVHRTDVAPLHDPIRPVPPLLEDGPEPLVQKRLPHHVFHALAAAPGREPIPVRVLPRELRQLPETEGALRSGPAKARVPGNREAGETGTRAGPLFRNREPLGCLDSERRPRKTKKVPSDPLHSLSASRHARPERGARRPAPVASFAPRSGF